MFLRCIRRLGIPIVPTAGFEVVTVRGQVAYLPLGSRINVDQIAAHGEVVAKTILAPYSEADVHYNEGQQHYVLNRDRWIQSGWRGKWATVDRNGNFALVTTEKEAMQLALALRSISGSKSCCVQCIGCEYSELAVMDDFVMDALCSGPPTVPSDRQSSVVNKSFYLRAEYSANGSQFIDIIFKHDSGATHVGVPRTVISNPPPGVDMSVYRAPNNVVMNSASGKFDVRQYVAQTFRVAGRTFTGVKILELPADRWLMGFPILSKFENRLNATATEPVQLIPLDPGVSPIDLSVDSA